MHGRLSAVTHEEWALFADLPREFLVVRYHSLAAVEPLPEVLRDRLDDGRHPMAVAHPRRPQWGVQFHPESICTEFGCGCSPVSVT